jgi:hypothetical protein
VPADAIVESVGVNVHLHHNDTLYYDNFPLVRSRLHELGVRHVRDGLIDTTWTEYYARHNQLGREGIGGTFIAAMDAPSALLEEYPWRMADSFEAYEAPNEPDASGDPNWVDKVRTVLNRLQAVRGWFPVYGPALTGEWAYGALGSIGSMVDAGNLHNYPSGRHAGTWGWGDWGYGSIWWHLELMRRITGSKHPITTETGYRNDSGAHDAVPTDIAARYMPRLLLEQFRAGIIRTFIYELVDSGPEQYGLLRSNGSPKPAFTAVKNLLSLLDDAGRPANVKPLDYDLQNEPYYLHHLALQKRDGTYYVAMWVEEGSYDVDSRSRWTVDQASVLVTVPSQFRILATITWQDDGTTRRVGLSGQHSETIVVNDRLTFVEVAQ